jgi:hypothetical protein
MADDGRPLPIGDAAHRVTSVDALEALYGVVGEAARRKEIDHVNADYAKFIAAAPFVVLASVGAKGVDVTPRGDPAGFVELVDPRTLLLPDRAGNNRLDTLRNLLVDDRVSLMFVVPRVREVLRVSGRAEISTDPALLSRFEMKGSLPATVLIVRVERAYPQCQKAFLRSGLWQPETWPEGRAGVPTIGEIGRNLTQGAIDAEESEAAYQDITRKRLY